MVILFMDHKIDQARNMKLLLSVLNNYLVLRLNLIKVKSSSSGKSGIVSCSMMNFLDAKKAPIPLDT
jgi:hypothetical protein